MSNFVSQDWQDYKTKPNDISVVYWCDKVEIVGIFYRWTFLRDGSDKSKRNVENRIVPILLPWGTPEETFVTLLTILLILTCCVFPTTYIRIQPKNQTIWQRIRSALRRPSKVHQFAKNFVKGITSKVFDTAGYNYNHITFCLIDRLVITSWQWIKPQTVDDLSEQ